MSRVKHEDEETESICEPEEKDIPTQIMVSRVLGER
jgi:hypothetical protein